MEGLGATDDRRTPVANLLPTRGWSAAEVEALQSDWSAANSTDREEMVIRASRLADLGTPPKYARAWLRTLYEIVNDPDRVRLSEQAHAWMNDNDASATDGPTDLVAAYAQATRGDHDLAMLAYQAALGPNELAEGLATGRCSRTSLLMLAGLRRQAVAEPGGVGS